MKIRLWLSANESRHAAPFCGDARGRSDARRESADAEDPRNSATEARLRAERAPDRAAPMHTQDKSHPKADIQWQLSAPSGSRLVPRAPREIGRMCPAAHLMPWTGANL